jgi:uncharacterized C2H2 Zn-finger protein
MKELIKNILLQETNQIKSRDFRKNNFIKQAIETHGSKYNYDDVDYVNSATKVNILCDVHGKFEQTPNDHIQGSGCPKCGREKIKKKLTRTQDEYIKKVEKVHNGKYTYGKTKYKNANSHIIITCPIHGDFSNTANKHLRGQGCPKCSGNFMDQDYFVELANKTHNELYDYSKVIYIDSRTPVEIICNEHGSFFQAPTNHIRQKQGCPICAKKTVKEKQLKRVGLDKFLERAKQQHGDKFDYSNVKYKGMHYKIEIVCPKHGLFTQTPLNHLYYGCAICSESQGERIVSKVLDSNNIDYVRQKRFKECFNVGKSGKCTTLPFDFYLPNFNTVIEYNGRQHYESVDVFGGEESLKHQKNLDKLKKDFCSKNNINMIIIPYKLSKDQISSFILTELKIKNV